MRSACFTRPVNGTHSCVSLRQFQDESTATWERRADISVALPPKNLNTSAVVDEEDKGLVVFTLYQ